ncbi:hypothetical protein BGZ80_006559, partial [Entomortierella chlamydospora]
MDRSLPVDLAASPSVDVVDSPSADVVDSLQLMSLPLPHFVPFRSKNSRDTLQKAV